jgi:DNA-binding response OmpR family regulator
MLGTPRRLRILVVDDDPAMVGAITALVGTEGHQVITAYDGLTAVRRFREERPDLVLLDLAMPGPDGFSVAGQIRAEGDVPILVVSGESAEAAKVRALGIGADDYLVKPFGRAELLARIAAIMRRADRSLGPSLHASASPNASTPSGEAARPAEGPRRGTQDSSLRADDGLTFDAGRHEARVGSRLLPLTPIEYRLLEVLARANGDVVPHLRLGRAGWPADADPDPLWLKPHLARLRRKLEESGGPLLVAVRSVGYRLAVDRE